MPERSRGLFALALVAMEVLLYLSQDMYLPALPTVREAFALTTRAAQWSFSAWLLGAATLQLAFGPLSQQLGRRRLMLSAALVFAAASGGCALATGYSFFIGCRIGQGACLGAVLVAGYACLHELFPAQQGVRTLAWMNSITVLAPALGPLGGALLLYVAPWRLLFVLLAGLALPTAALLAAAMPRDAPSPPPPTLAATLHAATATLRRRAVRMPLGAFCAVFATLVAWNVSAPFLFGSGPDAATRFALAQAALYAAFIAGTRVAAHAVTRASSLRALARGGATAGALGALLALGAEAIGARRGFGQLGFALTMASAAAAVVVGAGFGGFYACAAVLLLAARWLLRTSALPAELP